MFLSRGFAGCRGRGDTRASERSKILACVVCIAALAALSACGTRPMTGAGPGVRPECELLPGPPEYADTVRVALTPGMGNLVIEPWHAPWLETEAARFVFGHLYGTLVTVDCRGEMLPGLAVRWERREGGRRWTVELGGSARDWNGSPVTARDVVRSWRHPAVVGRMKDVLGVDSVAAAGDRIIDLYFDGSRRNLPRALAAVPFAVARPSDDSLWAVGSGPYRIVSWERGAPGSTRRAITVRPASGAAGPVVRFLRTEARDARDLLDGRAELLVTGDPSVIEYARGRSRFDIVPLPWERVYLLLSASRVRAVRLGRSPAGLSVDLTDELAADAVRHDARGWRSGAWWDETGGCGALASGERPFEEVPAGSAQASSRRRIVYDGEDGIARGLAERIVALAAAGPESSPGAAAVAAAVPGLGGGPYAVAAEGVAGYELRAGLRRGEDFAYILALPLRPVDPCFELKGLLESAPWLAGLEEDLAAALLPLIETRRHVIVARGAAGLTVDWFGRLLIENDLVKRR